MVHQAVGHKSGPAITLRGCQAKNVTTWSRACRHRCASCAVLAVQQGTWPAREAMHVPWCRRASHGVWLNWSSRAGVFGCPGALGRYLASTGRQFGADLNGEVQVRQTAGQLPQAFGDECGGLGNVTTALGDPRAQEDEFRPGKRR